MIKRKLFGNLLVWSLAIFFVVGALTNFFPPQQIQEDYQKWGYPGWFHYVTAVLELSTAVLLVLPRTRIAGSVIGACVMISAAATLLLHGEYTHALAPLIVTTFVAINARLTLRNNR